MPPCMCRQTTVDGTSTSSSRFHGSGVDGCSKPSGFRRTDADYAGAVAHATLSQEGTKPSRHHPVQIRNSSQHRQHPISLPMGDRKPSTLKSSMNPSAASFVFPMVDERWAASVLARLSFQPSSGRGGAETNCCLLGPS